MTPTNGGLADSWAQSAVKALPKCSNLPLNVPPERRTIWKSVPAAGVPANNLREKVPTGSELARPGAAGAGKHELPKAFRICDVGNSR